jgi:small subunit ribosomal protein S1
MTTNPNPESEEVREDAAAPAPAPEDTPRTANQADEGRETAREKAPAAEVLPTPAAPRLSTDFDPDSIVNRDYLEEEGGAGDLSDSEFLNLINQYEETLTDIQEGQILKGTVIEVRDNEVLLNIGFKSEGVIPIEEFGATAINVDDAFDVFLEKLENQDGLVVLSKERADFLKVWDKIKIAHENGDVVTGLVDRRIKGGLVVKLWGVDTFLPGSQVALRQVPNLEDMIGEEIQCRIIKKNKRRRNVVVSRRIVLEQEREEKKRSLISELEKGQVRTGVVKNITDFGAFVDLGGIDGLLHITDLSWGRVSHPSEVVAIGQEIEVKVLDFEEERERISLGLKQLQSYPWDNVEEKYPEESIVRGRVVSITNYGAFVELERGVEGLIHISEMSWTRHIKHPSKVVSIGDEVDVMVLKIDKENEKISLGLKQCESDPWLTLIERYPVGSTIEGSVRNLTDFGAFVEVEEGIDGLVHISDMSWTKRVRHPKEMLKRGDSVTVQILDIDTGKRRISLGIKQLHENPWPTLADDYPVGHTLEGTVSRMLDHGVIVEMGNDLEGFVPIGHLGIPKLDKPQYYFREDEKVDLKVIKMDVENRRIVLSIAERLKDFDEDAAQKFVESHPRLEDVVAADLEADGSGGDGSDEYADEAASVPDPVVGEPATEEPAAEAAPADEADAEDEEEKEN